MKLSTRIILFLSGLLIALSVTGYYILKDYKFQKSEVERQKTNVEVLNKNFKSYKNAHGQSVAEVQSLTYTVKELKTNEAELHRKLLTNNVKPKAVKSITEVSTSSHIEFKTPIQYVDTNKCFAYENQYYTVNGCFDADSAAVIVETRDSLAIIPEIFPAHRFLWWTWGQKGVKLTVTSNNPFSNITYLKYIELKK